MAKELEREDVGNGYYFTYKQKANGLGGYYSSNVEFHNDQTGLHKKITDRYGVFFDFPGVVYGDWCKKLKFAFHEEINFVFRAYYCEDGRVKFLWMVQPDGRYYADDDGFGMENDEEIMLFSYLDSNGNFTQPFEEEIS